MSWDVLACWQGELKADKAALQSALAELGFEAKVLYEFNEADFFWPIDLAGFKTGVQIRLLENLESEIQDYEVLGAGLGSRDRGAQFSFGSNSAEAGTAFALAAALAKLADAVIYDPQDEEFYSIEAAVAAAKTSFVAAREEGAQERED